MPRESSKCRLWEKERRNRLKESFDKLCKLLPCYDPSLTIAKIDILHNAATYIQDLQEKVKNFVAADSVKEQSDIIQKLQERIKRLITRNEQLYNLLRDAGISVPGLGTNKKLKIPQAWTNKINGEQAKVLQKKELEKENNVQPKKVTPRKTKNKLISGTSVAPKHRKVMINRKLKNLKKKVTNKIQNNSKCFIVISQPNVTQQSPCFIIRNTVTNNVTKSSNSTVLTNSMLLTNPLVSSNIKPSNFSNTTPPISALGPGTLILANGSVLPIIPQHTLLPPPQTIFTANAFSNTNNSAVIVVPNSVPNQQELNLKNVQKTVISSSGCNNKKVTSSGSVKSFPELKPKYCLTQVNKVPIPAFTSSHAKNYLVLNENKSEPVKVKFKSGDKKILVPTKIIKNSKNTSVDLKRKTTQNENAQGSLAKKAKIVAKHQAVNNEDCKEVCNIDKESNKAEIVVHCDNNLGVLNTKEVADTDNKVQEIDEPVLVEKNTSVKESLKENNEVLPQVVTPTVDEAKLTKEVTVCEIQLPQETVKESNNLPLENHKETSNNEKDIASPKENCDILVAEMSTDKEITLSTDQSEPIVPNRDTNSPKESTVPTTEIVTANTITDCGAPTEVTTSNKPETEPPKKLEEFKQANESLEIMPPTTTTSEPQEMKSLELNLNHSELSNDIFASLQVSSGCQNPESTSPTAAFLLAFPLVSSLNGVKVTEVIDEENTESQQGTPTLLQIGTMETTKPTQSQSDSLTPSLLNLDNLSFFSAKDVCGSFYNNSYEMGSVSTATSISTVTSTVSTSSAIMSSSTKSSNSVNTDVAKQVLPQKLDAVPNNELIKYADNDNKAKVVPKQSSCSNGLQINYERSSNPSHGVNNHNVAVTNSQNVHGIGVNSYQLKQPKQQVEIPQKPMEHKQGYVNQNKPYNSTQCVNNTFNTINDASKMNTNNTTCSYINNTSKSYSSAPLYTNSSNNYGYNYYPETNFNQNYYKNSNSRACYPAINHENYPDYRKNDNNNHFTSNYYNQTYKDNNNKFSSNVSPKGKILNNQNRPPINWMTTPDNRSQTNTDYVLTPFSKETDFSHNTIYPSNSFVSNPPTTYFNASAMYTTSDITSGKSLDIPLVPINSYQRNEVEENQFSWSPTKMPQFLDPPHTFVSSTLPTLVGDLALGNNANFVDQKNDNKCHKDVTRNKDNRRKNNGSVYDNQSNFFSVSQLVDHNKSDNNSSVPARTTSRRNSGNRNKNNSQQKMKRVNNSGSAVGSSNNKAENKEVVQNYTAKIESNGVNMKNNQLKMVGSSYNAQSSNEMYCDQKNNRNVPKNTPSNYSAEALIGGHHNISSDNVKRQNYASATNKSLPVPTFLPDNIIPYFPPVDLPSQDNNYMQQNQNYQPTSFGHNFTSSFTNNASFSSNSFMPPVTTTYLPSNNFMQDVGSTHDYMSSDNLNLFPNPNNKNDKHYNGNKNQTHNNRQSNTGRDDKSGGNQHGGNHYKKLPKKKHGNETGAGNIASGFDFPFLSMPGSINSPILPDDFHSHTSFLPPPTPYPCKNPLYPKQNTDLGSTSLLPLVPPGSRSGIQHPEISPSLNTAGTSLTNFNLSTIFPEINKGPLPDIFPEPRVKDATSRSYSSTSSQVPFNNKPTFSLSSYNNVRCDL